MKIALAVAALVALSPACAFAQAPPMGDPGQQAAPPTGAPAYAHVPPSPAMRQARQAMRQACAADVQRLCADAQASGQRPMQCLHQHMSEVSAGCVQAFQSMRAARQSGGEPAPQSGPQG